MHADPYAPSLVVPVDDADWMVGPAGAPVTLVEYGDFECPHCAQAHTVMQYVLQQLGDNVCFAYRHFPLATIHVHAVTAAESAECAACLDRLGNRLRDKSMRWFGYCRRADCSRNCYSTSQQARC